MSMLRRDFSFVYSGTREAVISAIKASVLEGGMDATVTPFFLQVKASAVQLLDAMNAPGVHICISGAYWDNSSSVSIVVEPLRGFVK